MDPRPPLQMLLMSLVVGLTIALVGCSKGDRGEEVEYRPYKANVDKVESGNDASKDDVEAVARVADGDPENVGDDPKANVEPDKVKTDDPKVEPGEVVSVDDPPVAKTNGTDDTTAAADKVDPKVPVKKPGGVQLLIKENEFKKEGPSGALRVSFDDFDLLKILNMDPVTPDAPALMPTWLTDLKGKRVRVRGFMYPSFLETGIARFILARDNQICCFGRDPKVYDLVIVTLKEGVTTDYIQGRPFDVVGKFRISEELPDGSLGGLYFIDDAIVIDR